MLRRLPGMTLRARPMGLRESKIHRAREDYSWSLYLITVAFMRTDSIKFRQQRTQMQAQLSVSNAGFNPQAPVETCMNYLRTIMRSAAQRGNIKATTLSSFFRQKKARSLRCGLLTEWVVLTLSKRDPKRRYDHVDRLATRSESHRALRQ